MKEEHWIAFWKRKAEELLGYVYLQFPGGELIKIECDEQDVAIWFSTYFGDTPRGADARSDE